MTKIAGAVLCLLFLTSKAMCAEAFVEHPWIETATTEAFEVGRQNPIRLALLWKGVYRPRYEAVNAIYVGDWKRVLAECDLEIKMNGQLADAYLLRAVVFDRLGQPIESDRDLREFQKQVNDAAEELEANRELPNFRLFSRLVSTTRFKRNPTEREIWVKEKLLKEPPVIIEYVPGIAPDIFRPERPSRSRE